WLPTPTANILTLSLHDALPILVASCGLCSAMASMSPVSATTVVQRLNDSRRFMRSPLARRSDKLPACRVGFTGQAGSLSYGWGRSEEHTSELQSLRHLVCRLLL